ncbi:unnamed protein product [Discula destructiva]
MSDHHSNAMPQGSGDEHSHQTVSSLQLSTTSSKGAQQTNNPAEVGAIQSLVSDTGAVQHSNGSHEVGANLSVTTTKEAAFEQGGDGLASANLLSNLPDKTNSFWLRVLARHNDCRGLIPIYMDDNDLIIDEDGNVTEDPNIKYDEELINTCDNMELFIEINLNTITIESLSEQLVKSIEADTEHQDSVYCASTVIHKMEMIFEDPVDEPAFDILVKSDQELREMLYRIGVTGEVEGYIFCFWEY